MPLKVHYFSWECKGETILKDKLLTQSAPDIYHKLQKQVFWLNQSLEKFLQLDQTVYYSRKSKEEKRHEKRTKEKPQPLVMAVKPLWFSLRKKMPRGAQVKRNRLAITVESWSISSEVALRHLSHPRLPVPSVKDHTGGGCPQRCRFQGSDSQGNQDWRGPGVSTHLPS